MPLYHFRLRDRMGDTRTDEGVALDDLEDALMEAVRGARSIMAEDVQQGRLDLSGVIEVFDDEGKRLLVLPFAKAIGFAEHDARARIILADCLITAAKQRIAEQEARIERLRREARDIAAPERAVVLFRDVLNELERYRGFLAMIERGGTASA